MWAPPEGRAFGQKESKSSSMRLRVAVSGRRPLAQHLPQRSHFLGGTDAVLVGARPHNGDLLTGGRDRLGDEGQLPRRTGGSRQGDAADGPG